SAAPSAGPAARLLFRLWLFAVLGRGLGSWRLGRLLHGLPGRVGVGDSLGLLPATAAAPRSAARLLLRLLLRRIVAVCALALGDDGAGGRLRDVLDPDRDLLADAAPRALPRERTPLHTPHHARA